MRGMMGDWDSRTLEIDESHDTEVLHPHVTLSIVVYYTDGYATQDVANLDVLTIAVVFPVTEGVTETWGETARGEIKWLPCFLPSFLWSWLPNWCMVCVVCVCVPCAILCNISLIPIAIFPLVFFLLFFTSLARRRPAGAEHLL
ncbi:hypothetical protein B0H67DRAFT_575818, partial [Lasiosphaeris hirsuta]